MEFTLSNDDLKIIGSAITWTLYTPFYRSDAPEFSGYERDRLQLIFDCICRLRQEAGNRLDATINETSLIVQNFPLTSNCEEVQHIIMCVRSFYNEIGHSPSEVLAVTGIPIAKLESLSGRLLGLRKFDGTGELIKYRSGDTNLYCFVTNNPITENDFSGLAGFVANALSFQNNTLHPGQSTLLDPKPMTMKDGQWVPHVFVGTNTPYVLPTSELEGEVWIAKRPCDKDCGCGVYHPWYLGGATFTLHWFVVVKDQYGRYTTYGYDGTWHRNKEADQEFVGWWWIVYRETERLTPKQIENAYNKVRNDRGNLTLDDNCKTHAEDLLESAGGKRRYRPMLPTSGPTTGGHGCYGY